MWSNTADHSAPLEWLRLQLKDMADAGMIMALIDNLVQMIKGWHMFIARDISHVGQPVNEVQDLKPPSPLDLRQLSKTHWWIDAFYKLQTLADKTNLHANRFLQPWLPTQEQGVPQTSQP